MPQDRFVGPIKAMIEENPSFGQAPYLSFTILKLEPPFNVAAPSNPNI